MMHLCHRLSVASLVVLFVNNMSSSPDMDIFFTIGLCESVFNIAGRNSTHTIILITWILKILLTCLLFRLSLITVMHRRAIPKAWEPWHWSKTWNKWQPDSYFCFICSLAFVERARLSSVSYCSFWAGHNKRMMGRGKLGDREKKGEEENCREEFKEGEWWSKQQKLKRMMLHGLKERPQ